MGSTRWRNAGRSLILDESKPDQGRATADSSRRNELPNSRLGQAYPDFFVSYGVGTIVCR